MIRSKPSRRAIFGAFVLSALTSLAQSQTRTIHLVVPYGTGAVQDTIARTFSVELGQALNATVVIENKPGAGGTVGTAQVAKAVPDGNTLVVAAASHHLAGHLYNKLPYDPLKDFVGAALLGYTGYVIAAPTQLGAQNLADFVRIVKSKPGDYNYASAGNGSATHLGMASFAARAGLQGGAHCPTVRAPPRHAVQTRSAVSLRRRPGAGARGRCRRGCAR